jgi:hypothetical protein
MLYSLHNPPTHLSSYRPCKRSVDGGWHVIVVSQVPVHKRQARLAIALVDQRKWPLVRNIACAIKDVH